ncbi:hypothetical protein [Spirosoma aerolatum]|uniref:hypothetical protein n=1 Tax=Spirosoma aerolatum TaxID=1211326 RepID=UPI0009AD13E1|nr:hypothetical protein [Spirosoma aerolatum]
MNRLSRDQLTHLEQQLQQTSPHQALQAELLDHMASLIEQRMDQGQIFTDAFDQVIQQANPQALNQLKQLYLQEFPSPLSTVSMKPTRIGLRHQRRPATKPFQYMLLSSVLTFLILVGFLVVVSRPLAIPMRAFQTAWGALGLMGIVIVRWWLSRKGAKPKRFQTT